MQHDSSSDNSGADSGPSPIDNAQSTHVGFTIARQESDILKGYLEDFQQADTGGCANIIHMAMGEIYQLGLQTPHLTRRRLARYILSVD